MMDTLLSPAIEIRDLHHSYGSGDCRLEILKGVNCVIPYGKWYCILGASGCGKTTLLNLIGALERPDSGEIVVGGVDLGTLSRRAAAKFRSEYIGFVFQSYHLLPELNILENVALAARIAGIGVAEAEDISVELLTQVGLKDRLTHRPPELSGGEQQRAAIARALINDPPVILADEPTGNLDAKSGDEVLDLFRTILTGSTDRTVLMITHNRDIARLADGVLMLENGLLTEVTDF